jgi:hypothetical protein
MEFGKQALNPIGTFSGSTTLSLIDTLAEHGILSCYSQYVPSIDFPRTPCLPCPQALAYKV